MSVRAITRLQDSMTRGPGKSVDDMVAKGVMVWAPGMWYGFNEGKPAGESTVEVSVGGEVMMLLYLKEVVSVMCLGG